MVEECKECQRFKDIIIDLLEELREERLLRKNLDKMTDSMEETIEAQKVELSRLMKENTRLEWYAGGYLTRAKAKDENGKV